MQTAAELMDSINRRAWQAPDALDWYSSVQGYTDAGEHAAMKRIAAEFTNQPILDIGVGGGRTVPLLRAISQDYTAIDYTPALVAACKARYPEVRVLCGDARNLGPFDDGSFALVVFSFNGIDSVNADDRMQVLREVHRVLRAGGAFLFSTHNQQGPLHRESFKLGIHLTRNPFKLAMRIVRAVARARQTLSNYRRYSKLNHCADGYSIMNAAAHNHGIVIHYITVERQLVLLAAAGFGAFPAIFGLDGQLVSRGEDTSRHMWLHFMARKEKNKPATTA